MKDSERLVQYMESKLKEMCGLLEKCVQLESPSHEDKTASDRCNAFFKNLLEKEGFDVEVKPQIDNGDHLIAHMGTGIRGTMCVGHYDTVFPIGDIIKNPFRIEDGKAYGPGILDMKGGIIMGIYAVKALKELGMMPDKRITFFLNGDEESGSFNSSKMIVEEAKKHDNVIVLEPGYNELGSIKKTRYGRGTYELIVRGKMAHSGTNPNEGINPVVELTYQIQKLLKLYSVEKGISIVPTYIKGGIKGTCMIPDTTYVSFDVRAKTAEMLELVDKKIKSVKPVMKGIHIDVKGGIDKPPLPEYKELIEAARKYADELDIELIPENCMGGSDGNFTGGAGIPTIDGLGMSGLYLHTHDEYINMNHIVKRTALVARLIENI